MMQVMQVTSISTSPWRVYSYPTNNDVIILSASDAVQEGPLQGKLPDQ